MALRSERKRIALRETRQDREALAADGGRVKASNDIRKFEEIGTHSAAPRLAIGEALLFHNGLGGKRKEARLRYLSRYWMDRLKGIPKVSFNTSFDPNQSCAIGNVNIEGIDPAAIGSLPIQQASYFYNPDRSRGVQGYSHHAKRLHHPRRTRPLLATNGDHCPQGPPYGLTTKAQRHYIKLTVLCLRVFVVNSPEPHSSCSRKADGARMPDGVGGRIYHARSSRPCS